MPAAPVLQHQLLWKPMVLPSSERLPVLPSRRCWACPGSTAAGGGSRLLPHSRRLLSGPGSFSGSFQAVLGRAVCYPLCQKPEDCSAPCSRPFALLAATLLELHVGRGTVLPAGNC